MPDMFLLSLLHLLAEDKVDKHLAKNTRVNGLTCTIIKILLWRPENM